jgi:hypothetical protein
MRTKCSVHLILLDLIDLIISGEEYTLRDPPALLFHPPSPARTDARLHKYLTLARGVTPWSACLSDRDGSPEFAARWSGHSSAFPRRA